jgi:beta-galactosidase
MRTTGKPTQLSMSADRPAVTANGKDLIFVTIRIEDKNRLLVPRSNNQLNFSIEGPGKIVATDNGDATSHESFRSSTKKAYNGMCLVIVAAEKGASGTITLKGESKGLKGSSVVIGIQK